VRLSSMILLLSVFSLGAAVLTLSPAYWTFLALGLFAYALSTFLSESGH